MKKQTHKYKVGDIVGICSDCMADCKILKRIPKVKGQVLSYVATAVIIHHPKPKESWFGQNKEFTVREDRIVVKLSKGK